MEDHCRATHFLNLTANFYVTVSEGFVKCKTPNQLCQTIFFLEKYSLSRFKKYNKSYEYDLLINLSIGKIFGKNPQLGRTHKFLAYKTEVAKTHIKSCFLLSNTPLHDIVAICCNNNNGFRSFRRFESYKKGKHFKTALCTSADYTTNMT